MISNLVKAIRCDHDSTIGAGGIIYDTKSLRILIVRGHEKWSLPKGHSEPGESPHETAMREIYEETSLRVTLQPNDVHKKILKVVYFLIPMEQGVEKPIEPIDTQEVIDVRWVTRQELTQIYPYCNKQLRYLYKHWDYMMYCLYRKARRLLQTH